VHSVRLLVNEMSVTNVRLKDLTTLTPDDHRILRVVLRVADLLLSMTL